ncbi:hypothetical protein CASFOL_041747 [Castilleja foliolosa]|uniref:Uncharacterized protein n=1 Tax=Castilleja foliolosa TaxID=1961234 RepID=A0ABD3B8J7_9LAMI
MGCAASKLDNEDTVRRCKERRRLIKEAVYARHHLAAAHSDYCRSLRLTGSALVTFASGEPLAVSHHSPAVLLHTPSFSSSSAPKPPSFIPPPPHHHPSPSPSLYKPPPPPPISTTSSHHQSHPPPPPPIRRKKPIKVPHILSDSSFTSSPPPNPHDFTYNARANSTYTATPSQASSVWNWDNFYPPPSPPTSEHFQNLTKKKNPKSETDDVINSDDDDDYTDNDSNPQNPTDKYHNPFSSDPDRESNYSSYSRYSEKGPIFRKGPGPKRYESEEDETEREEVQCSEWGDHDHYSSTSSSSDEGEETDDLKSRSDFGSRSSFGPVNNVGSNNAKPANTRSSVNVGSKFSSISEKLSSEDDEKSSVSWGDRNNNINNNNQRGNSDRRIVVRHKDLAEIVAAIKEYFDKAASAGEQVSEMLETGRAQLDGGFKHLRKTVYHSSGMLSSLSSSWTSKPPLAVKYRFEPDSIEQSGGSKSLCSTLERLLAWEKKLCQEVKVKVVFEPFFVYEGRKVISDSLELSYDVNMEHAGSREGVKIEHEKKLSSLQSQEYKGNEAKLDKTKTTLKRLQSLIVVTSQAVSTTSSAIIGLRDSDLVPQLVELCHGFMYMWRSMNQFHENQNDIVQQVRGLVNQTNKAQSTSDLHRQATRDLESAVSTWHSTFCRLAKFQRDFVHSLQAWFKLTLIPVSAKNTENNNNKELSNAFVFCDEWKLALDRVPDTVASESIKSFINVVHSISLKQTEEIKIKKRTEIASRELEKKASSLRSIERKYYQSYSMVGIGVPDNGPDSNGLLLDSRDPLAEKKAELSSCRSRVEDEMQKHAKAAEVTRAMTLNNIQTGLPGVFQAMTSFSALMNEALETVCNRSYTI